MLRARQIAVGQENTVCVRVIIRHRLDPIATLADLLVPGKGELNVSIDRTEYRAQGLFEGSKILPPSSTAIA